MAKKVLIVCGQEIICERNDGGKKCSFRNYDLFCKVFGNENVYLCMLTNYKAEDKEKVFRLVAYKTTIERGINIARGALFTSVANEQKIISFIEKNCISIVVFERSMYGSLITKIKKQKLPCELWVFVHNVERRYFENKMKCHKILYSLPYWRIAKSEKETFKYSDYIITLTLRDAQLINKLYGRNSDLILPMTFYDEFDDKKLFKNGEQDTKELLFIGTMFAPNYEGIKWFVDYVMPELNGFHLVIVGKDFELKRTELESKNVRVVGTVESLDQYYYSNNIMIMPIFYGDGMKIKTAEAMMYGKTILASDEALEGYEVNDVQGIYRCNTREEYLETIHMIERNENYYNKSVRNLFLSKYCLNNQIYECKRLWT
mgnify:CR=1 FL=1